MRRLVPLALLIAPALLSGCGDDAARVAAAPGPEVHATLDATGADPLALAGRAALVRADHAVWRIDAGGARRRVFADPHLRTAEGSADRLAVVVSTADLRLRGPSLGGGASTEPDPAGVTAVRAGPWAGPLRDVVRCRGQAAVDAGFGPMPVAGEGVVAAVGCDGRAVVVLDGIARRSVDAGGDVLALAAAGRTVGWIARAKPGAPPAVTLLDLATGARRTVARLPAVPGDTLATLALAADGRWRAQVTLPSDAHTVTGHEPCAVVTRAAGASRPASTRAGRCLSRVLYTDAGSLERALLDGSVVRRDRDGRALATLSLPRSLYGVATSFATDGRRLAAITPSCTGVRLDAIALPRVRPPAPASCPIAVPARWPVSRDGTVRVHVRCPRGCRALAEDLGLSVVLAGDTPLNLVARPDLRVAPGGTATLAFAGGRRLRAGRATRAELAIGGGTALVLRRGTLTR